MSLIKFLDYFGPLSTIIPAIIGLIRSKSLSKKLRLLLLYCIIIAAKEITCVILAQNGYRNLAIYNIANIIDSIPLFLIYYLEFKSKNLKQIILSFIIVSTLFSILNIIWLQGFLSFNTFSIFSVNFFKTITTLLYFYILLKEAENLNLIKTPLFWVSAGLLIYSVGTSLIFSLYEIYLEFPVEISDGIWAINSLLYIFLNILFSIAFLCQPKNKTY